MDDNNRHPPEVKYWRDESGELWWCNSHGRRATFIHKVISDYPQQEIHCCAPGLGGILLPCYAVNLTGLVEIEED
jgi:hypothetical protein